MWLFKSSTDERQEVPQEEVVSECRTPILNEDYREDDNGADDEDGENEYRDHNYVVNDPEAKQLEHISMGDSSIDAREAIGGSKRKWKREYVMTIVAFMVAALTFVSCFVFIPRSPSMSVKRTNVAFATDISSLTVQQTYSLANRNVYKQRIKKFLPQMKYISNSRRIVTVSGTPSSATSFDTQDFVIDKTSSRTIVMDYVFSLGPDEYAYALQHCDNVNEGIYLTTTGSLEMQTFGKDFDNINLGMTPTLVHCNNE
jgi:hypothetical protein